MDHKYHDGCKECTKFSQPSSPAVRKRIFIGAALGLIVFAVALGLGLGLYYGLRENERSQTPSSVDSSQGSGSAAFDDQRQISEPEPVRGPVIDENFADPCYIEVDGTYYAFATNRLDRAGPDQINIQVAKSNDFINWNVTGGDALPNIGNWASGQFVWAPDVVRVADGTFVLYYSAQHEERQRQCVHAAVANHVEGPYRPIRRGPLICPFEEGGAIDPEGFQDTDGTRYILYKVDGNSNNREGQPMNPTPIMLQRVQEDGVTMVGGPYELLDRTDEDGPMIEAPSLGYYQETEDSVGLYVLFYNSNLFSTDLYKISYATSNSIGGPFRRAGGSLMETGDGNGDLIGPGGFDIGVDSRKAVFHSRRSNTGESLVRTMWTAEFAIEGNTVRINFPD